MARLVSGFGAFGESWRHNLAHFGIEYGVFSEENGLGESADTLPEFFAEGHGTGGARLGGCFGV